MRRLGALCLCLGLTAPALAADPPPAEEPSVPWYRWLFLGERAKPAPVRPHTASKDKPPAARPGGTTAKEAAARSVAEEQRVYLDRLKAISRIREVANDLRDEELLRRADDLEAQAEEIFKQRTALLPGAGNGRDDRALLERGRDDRPATAERPASRRPNTRGENR